MISELDPVEHVLKIGNNGTVEGCREVYSKSIVDDKFYITNTQFSVHLQMLNLPSLKQY